MKRRGQLAFVLWAVPGYPEIGIPDLSHAFTEGISQGCHHCGYDPEDEEYSDIELRKDKIVDVKPSDGSIHYGAELWVVVDEPS
ncbi:hypothetical protein GCM10010404_68730 [Nonomuraea africana]|uniref:PASTA domain-containing protein n=1 Tax=Nonomuraea africana TaxID=46171 RepID=A0ABR9K6R2_9ACTN|nr:hypothetical protein [Nonomuraea africana]MBE1557699.1 hypothetical protein [Nonomuraea africana]